MPTSDLAATLRSITLVASTQEDLEKVTNIKFNVNITQSHWCSSSSLTALCYQENLAGRSLREKLVCSDVPTSFVTFKRSQWRVRIPAHCHLFTYLFSPNKEYIEVAINLQLHHIFVLRFKIKFVYS